MNKKKIVNDPVYGFINIPSELIYDLVEHPYFQRLRRIKQLGLANLVYPGAFHTRFQHALGATYLMNSAIEVIRSKGHDITEEEALSLNIAILLHDIGHGPFSHSLEHSIVDGITHEDLSVIFMQKLNTEFGGKLELAIQIFQNKYHKTFLHQLVSSQLDMDRLDYLRRDSYFTGVSEGVVGSDRIIKMLDVVDDQLVVESKGIYSIESFLTARRLMYWQVYFHKTAVSAEALLVKILKRAKELTANGENLFATPALKYFLSHKVTKQDFRSNTKILNHKTTIDLFADLDDYDIIASTKVWSEHEDPILSNLCRRLINRDLLKIQIQEQKFNEKEVIDIRSRAEQKYKLNSTEADYFVFTDFITNNAYDTKDDKINILYNSGELKDIREASDLENITVLSKNVKKYFLCYPKECSLL